MVRNGAYDFAMLQESHSTLKTEGIWTAEWGGNIYYSHGLSNARGVMIILPRNSDIKVLQQFQDTKGRLIILHIQKGDSTFVICNIYAPTQDHLEDQLITIDQLEEEITKMEPTNIIIGGDMNVCMDISLDRGASTRLTPPSGSYRYRARIEALMESLHLADLWRSLHPTTRQFSFRRAQAASRLDYWLVSEHMLDSKAKSAITPYPLSDHAAITLRVGNTPAPRGPGLWRIDNELLHNEEYCRVVRDLLTSEQENPEGLNPQSHWDWVKHRIKTVSSDFTREQKRKAKEVEKILTGTYQELRKKADSGLPYDELALQSCERELKEIEIRRACRAIERSRANWAMAGERPSKYFLNLQKLQAKNNSICQLVTEKGDMLTQHKDILAEQKDFYQKLYSQQDSTKKWNPWRTSDSFLKMSPASLSQARTPWREIIRRKSFERPWAN